MAATILNSAQAVQMSVFVVRAFVRMKKMMLSFVGWAEELAVLRRELRGRLDLHESAINDILKRMMRLLDPPYSPPVP